LHESAHEHAVTFATKNGRPCTLTPVEFLRRFLLHVLPSGFHKIRHYGLCASYHVAQGTIEKLRKQLQAQDETSNTTPSSAVQQPFEQSAALAPITTLECMLALTGIDVLRCPRCAHGRMLPAPLPDTCSAPHRLDTS
jgi:hypothetical protein